jgi:hypothetical protein
MTTDALACRAITSNLHPPEATLPTVARNLDKTVVARFGNETFDVGMDEGSPVSEAYGPPFAFPGTIRKVQIQLSPSRLSARDRQQLRNASGQLAMGVQ